MSDYVLGQKIETVMDDALKPLVDASKDGSPTELTALEMQRETLYLFREIKEQLEIQTKLLREVIL